jgi:hypothetical protein
MLIIAFGACVTASAAVVPFTEDFSASSANWADNSGMNVLNHVASGGPDAGAYATAPRSLNGSAGSSVVLFRAQDEFNSSDHAFEGNWVAQGVGQFSAFVRHNAPVPLSYFTRFSDTDNFPGGTAVKFAPVLPNTWTQLRFDIRADNPEFVTFEGSSFGAVFSNIGHVQIGVSGPAALATDPTVYTFDIDKASIVMLVPEPASVLAAVIAGLLVLCRRRRTA